MSEIVIRTEGLGKRYRLGAKVEPYRTVRETVSSWFSAPAKLIRSGLHRKALGGTEDETFWAVRDVSLEIRRGEVVGLIGSNGSGKSTLLKLLSRITEPTSGIAEVRGRVGALLEVGAGFHPELTGRENIFLNGAILGLKHAEVLRRLDEIVEFAEVAAFLDVPVKRYSSGMHMRLAFSVAAHIEPDVMLVDEVLAVGDAAFRKKCLAKLKSLTADSGRTVVFVSHDMSAIHNLCSTAVRLEEGQAFDIGEVRAVIERYQAKASAKEHSRSWDDGAPGDDEIQLRFIDVSPGRGFGVCQRSEDIIVTMGIHANVLLRGLCIGFDVVSSSGITVLRSYQTDLPEDICPEVRIGTNTLQCTIAPELLNVGEYYICPKISVHNSYWIVNGDAIIRFQIFDSPTDVATHPPPGIIAPVLTWQMQD